MAVRGFLPSLPSRLLLFTKTSTGSAFPNVSALTCRSKHFLQITSTSLASFSSLQPVECCKQGATADNFSRRLLQPSVSWCVTRGLAKKVSKAKDKAAKGGKKKVHMELTPEELDGVLNLPKLQKEMLGVVEDLKQQMLQNVSLRTTVAVYDHLPIKTDDGMFPLVQLAQIFQKTPSLILINMSSSPQYIPAVKDAIAQSGLNVNPQQDGTTLFIPVPKVTREHRETLAKNAKMIHDKAKTKLRDIHNKYVKKVKGAKEHHSEDVLHGAQEMVLQEMHSYEEQLDKILEAKQNELLNVSMK